MSDIKKISCKRITLGIFLLMLVITLMPSLTCTNLNYESTKAPENNQTTLPTWVKGEKWTFNISYFSIAYLDYFSLNGKLNRLDFLVESITPDFYNVTVQGNLTSGELKLNLLEIEISGYLLNTSVRGYILFRKSNLSIDKVVLHADGYLKAIIKHRVKFYIILEPQPEYKYIDFPVYVGKNWVILATSLNMLMNLEIGNLINITLPSDDIPMCLYIPPDEVNCIDKINDGDYKVCILQGTIGECEQLWYSPNIENLYRVILQDFIVGDSWSNCSFYVDVDAKFEILKVKANVEGLFQPGKPLNFTGDAEGGVLINNSYKEWRWDFGDGTVGLGQNISHVYTKPGNYTINLTVTDMLGNRAVDIINVIISASDNEPPLVTIVQPTPGLYIFNKRLLPIPKSTAIIIGRTDIRVNATDSGSGINHVEFYIDNKLKANDTTEPYVWIWSEKTFGRHIVKVIAYDNAENSASDEITIWKFF